MRSKYGFKPSLDSNRNGHLTAAIAASVVTAGAAIALGKPELLVTSASIYIWELVATPDMDHDSRRPGRGIIRSAWVLYWRPFALAVEHRSPLSHSLFIGLPARLGYVFAFPALAIAGLVIVTGITGWAAIILAALPFVKWGLTGCAIADVVHLSKDGYGILEMFFGRD